MHFAKWIRKNSKKIMVFVVIFSMVSFIIGYTGLQLFFSFFGGDTQLVGKYDGGKIRVREYRQAQNELQLLRVLEADTVLMAHGQQGLAGPLLMHQLFPDSRHAANLGTRLKQAARSGELPVSTELVETFFSERTQPEIAWLLLKAEAAQAGSAISDGMARQVLEQILPQLAQGADAGQVLSAISAKTHVTEAQLVRTFAELLGVMFYVGNITDSQAATLPQIQAVIGRSQEKFDAEFVTIPAGEFIDNDTPIAPDALEQQFQAYKTILPGTVTDDNPFGFGYKLPKRVQLEYMAVLLDDVKTQIEKPTAENLEDYYSRNIDRYKEPADPDDPDGGEITKTRSFAEVLPRIRSSIEQERVMRLANQIFNDARIAVEQGLATLNVEEAAIEQLQAAAGDYADTATSLSGRYAVPILTGKTGVLSPADVAQDSILAGLRLQHGSTPVPLSEIVFAARLDAKDIQRQIGVPIVRPWENIGPMTGGYYDETAGKYHGLMVMVRIADIQESAVPETIDVSYDRRGVVLLPAQRTDAQATVFSLADQVAADIRRTKAMEAAAARANELAEKVAEHGWEKGLEAFNAEYAGPDIALQTVSQQSRMSQAEMDRMRRYMAANPASASFLRTRFKTNALNQKLYALLPDGEQTTENLHQTLKVPKADAAYVVRSVTRIPAAETDYLDNKAMTAMQLSMNDASDLALIHLNPQNLFDRMHYVADQTPVIPVQEPVLPPPGEGF